MLDLKSIPDDMKWKLSSQLAASLPAMYEVVFRPEVGKRFDELEQRIWVELGNLSFDIARSLQLPIKNSQDLAQSMKIVMMILFGPDYKGEILDVGEDGAVIIVKRCPFANELRTIGSDSEQAFHRCLAFNLTSMKKLNPKYSSRYVRAMCMGDRQCEIRVGIDKEESKKHANEKPN